MAATTTHARGAEGLPRLGVAGTHGWRGASVVIAASALAIASDRALLVVEGLLPPSALAQRPTTLTIVMCVVIFSLVASALRLFMRVSSQAAVQRERALG